MSATALGAAPASADDIELNEDFTYTCNVVAAGLPLGDHAVGVNARVVIPEVVAPGDEIPARKTQITLTLPETLRNATYGLLGARSASGYSNDASISITVPGITDPFVYPIANLAAPWSPVPATSTPPWQIPTEGDVPAIPVPTTAEYPGLELPTTGTIHMPRAFNVTASLRNAAGELVGGEGAVTMACTLPAANDDTFGSFRIEEEEIPNTPPTAGNVTASTDFGAPVDITLAGADADPDDTLTYTYGEPANGTVTGEGANVTYTPDEGFSGTDTFTYTVSDGEATATGTVTVNVGEAPNQAPTANDGAAAAQSGDPVDITLSASDPDGDDLTYTYTQPENGTVSGEGPNVTYTSDEGFSGTDTFTFTVDDGNGGTDTATITVSVTADPPANIPPTAGNVTAETNEGTAVDITLLGEDADEGDELTYTYGTPANGTVTGEGANVTYTPNEGFSGTDTFTYTVSDGEAEATGTVTVTVNEDTPPPNTPPTAGDVTATTNEGTAVDITLEGADADEGDELTYTYGTPENGTVTGEGANVTYTPNDGFTGTDTFTYTVSDGEEEATGTVTVTVTEDTPPPNTPPTAGNVTATTNQDKAVNIALRGADADGDTLTYTYGTPANGTVTGTGANVTYTPKAGFSGTDTFTYTVSDGQAEATGTVTVTVTKVTQPPADKCGPMPNPLREPVKWLKWLACKILGHLGR